MPDIDPEDCLWGKDFFETYLHHAKKKSYMNTDLHKMAALSLIGQSLRNVWIRADQTKTDCRIHPFVIQSSGTGKNSAFGLMGTVAEAADMKFDEEGTASTAGIMGTVKQNGEVKKGDLAGNGFVAWKEAQTLLKSAEQTHSSDILEVINMALDPEGKVEKTLSGGKLEYSSRTSLFCTTYPPEPDGQVELIQQGFLPRTLFYYRNVGESFYDEVNKMRDQNVPEVGDSNSNYRKSFERDVEKLANTLKYIEDTVWEYGDVAHDDDSHYASGKEEIHYFEGVEKGVSIDPTDMLNSVLDEYSQDISKQAQPFKTRYFDMTYRIAAALAAVDYDEKNGNYVSRVIRQPHVKNAKKIVETSWRSVLEFIQDYQSVDGDADLRRVYRSAKDVCSTDEENEAKIKEIMNETWMDLGTVKRKLGTLEDMDRVKSNGTSFSAADAEDKVIIPNEELDKQET